MTSLAKNRQTSGFALDHLVLAAASLEAGSEYIWHKFGVRPDPGGTHKGWGTHNSLMQVGGGTYLEIIAPDPSQPDPNEPRPFGIDSPQLHERIAVRPRLVHYMLRTADIAATSYNLDYDPGPIKNMSRGDLHWQLTVRPMRGQPDEALMPSLINWGQSIPPAGSLLTRGVVLTTLHVRGPAALRVKLAPLAQDRRIKIGEHDSPMLAAEFQTPSGWAILD